MYCMYRVGEHWAVSLWVWVEFLSKILGLIAARGLGFILQSNTEQQLSRWRGGVEERIILMIQSAADILGKVHKWGWGGGLYLVYHFWPRIGGQNSSSCSFPPPHFIHLLLELLFWPTIPVQKWHINSAPHPPPPTHGVCLCLRPNLIPGFSGVDWGGGGCISFLTSDWRPK